MNDWLSIFYHALQDFYYCLLNQNIIQLPAKFSTKKSQPLKTMIGFSLYYYVWSERQEVK